MRLYLEKNPSQKRAGVVAQGICLEFKFQYHKKKQRMKPILSHCFQQKGAKHMNNKII
jgi:hypothetical protein